MKGKFVVLLGILLLSVTAIWSFKRFNFNKEHKIGEVLDSLHGVKVYYNGGVSHVLGRNVANDGYNIGLRYQCVEFVKRYYYEHYSHKMPNAYGHAKDFYNPKLKDGSYNKDRNLTQYQNPSASLPKEGDLLVFSGHAGNPFGHVAIVSKVGKEEIEIIQQNPGPYSPSRDTFPLVKKGTKWKIEEEGLLGWLSKK